MTAVIVIAAVLAYLWIGAGLGAFVGRIAYKGQVERYPSLRPDFLAYMVPAVLAAFLWPLGIVVVAIWLKVVPTGERESAR